MHAKGRKRRIEVIIDDACMGKLGDQNVHKKSQICSRSLKMLDDLFHRVESRPCTAGTLGDHTHTHTHQNTKKDGNTHSYTNDP